MPYTGLAICLEGQLELPKVWRRFRANVAGRNLEYLSSDHAKLLAVIELHDRNCKLIIDAHGPIVTTTIGFTIGAGFNLPCKASTIQSLLNLLCKCGGDCAIGPGISRRTWS